MFGNFRALGVSKGQGSRISFEFRNIWLWKNFSSLLAQIFCRKINCRPNFPKFFRIINKFFNFVIQDLWTLASLHLSLVLINKLSYLCLSFLAIRHCATAYYCMNYRSQFRDSKRSKRSFLIQLSRIFYVRQIIATRENVFDEIWKGLEISSHHFSQAFNLNKKNIKRKNSWSSCLVNFPENWWHILQKGG